MFLYCLDNDYSKLIKIVLKSLDNYNISHKYVFGASVHYSFNPNTHVLLNSIPSTEDVYLNKLIATNPIPFVFDAQIIYNGKHNTYTIVVDNPNCGVSPNVSPNGTLKGMVSRDTIKFKHIIWNRIDMSDPRVCDKFINKSIHNAKDISYDARFIDILSDPNNLFIKRSAKAGTMDGDYIYMHNDIKVHKNSYYEDFSRVFILNRGCHEPSEERMFQEVLKYMPNGATMIELGSYWAYYTMWFNKCVKNAINYCIEPVIENMQYGIDNCKLNNVKVNSTQMFISKDNFINYLNNEGITKIDLLHSDIQGYELDLIKSITSLLIANSIRYLIISTHSDMIHYIILNLLKDCNYRIIASADFETETFCFDGLIVACCGDNNEMPTISLGNRKHTALRSNMYFTE